MNQYIAWIDTETTGTDPHNDLLLEVAVIVTDRDLVEEERHSWVLEAHPTVLRLTLNEYVGNMHTANGLLDEVRLSTTGRNAVDRELAELLERYLTTDDPIGWGGSGTSHFDNRFLEVHLPETHSLLTYWTYDVGVIRRYWRDLFGLPVPSHLTTAKPHRALADIELHLDEARWYRDWLAESVRLGETPKPARSTLDDRRFDPAMIDVACHLDSIAQSIDRLTTIAENAVGIGGVRVDLSR